MTKFTDDELKTIGAAAQRVWSEIAYDIFQGEGVGDSLPKADVIELVLDASRLESQLRYQKASKDFVDRVGTDIYGKDSVVERYLTKSVFTHAHYGM